MITYLFLVKDALWCEAITPISIDTHSLSQFIIVWNHVLGTPITYLSSTTMHTQGMPNQRKICFIFYKDNLHVIQISTIYFVIILLFSFILGMIMYAYVGKILYTYMIYPQTISIKI